MDCNSAVVDLERILDYTFKDRQLAVGCLYHGGLRIYFDGAYILPERNERLAIVGDNILDTLLIRTWFTSRDTRGHLFSRMEWKDIIRNDLATNKQLATRGRTLGLDACVIKDPGTATVSPGMIATTFEAIIGAVYVDSGANGLDVVHRVVDRLGFFDHPFFRVT